MSLIKVHALVLRNLRMGDTSRIVTVLSRELGKWSAVAKGAREPKSRIGASLEIGNVAELVVYFRSGRDLQLVSDGSLEIEHRGLLDGAERYRHGCAVLEFLDRVLEEEASVPEVYDLSLRALALLETSPLGRLGYLLRSFQFRTAAWLGYAPRLEGCAICDAPVAPFFAPAEGGLLCLHCVETSPGALPAGEETIALLQSLLRGSLPRQPSNPACREMERIVEAFLAYHIDRYRGLRSLRIPPEGVEIPRS
ncbi:MAG: DNA repair protein RecO [Candidatus Eisenbacteria bacterium]|nr:DNA repair protein RecO [Candidatus Eisenbacteria bacterium]